MIDISEENEEKNDSYKSHDVFSEMMRSQRPQNKVIRTDSHMIPVKPENQSTNGGLFTLLMDNAKSQKSFPQKSPKKKPQQSPKRMESKLSSSSRFIECPKCGNSVIL